MKKYAVYILTSVIYILLALIFFVVAFTRPISEISTFPTLYNTQFQTVLPLYIVSFICFGISIVFAFLVFLNIQKKKVYVFLIIFSIFISLAMFVISYFDYSTTSYETAMEWQGNIDNIDAIKIEHDKFFPYENVFEGKITSDQMYRIYTKQTNYNSVNIYVQNIIAGIRLETEYFQTTNKILLWQYISQNPTAFFINNYAMPEHMTGIQEEYAGIQFVLYKKLGNYEIRIIDSNCVFVFKCTGLGEECIDIDTFKKNAVEQFYLLRKEAYKHNEEW